MGEWYAGGSALMPSIPYVSAVPWTAAGVSWLGVPSGPPVIVVPPPTTVPWVSGRGADATAGTLQVDEYATLYETDQRIRSLAVYRDAEGNVADPSIVGLSLTAPDGRLFGYPELVGSPIVRDGIGAYHFDFTPDIPGFWRVQWEGHAPDFDVVTDQVLLVREPFV